MNREIEIIIDGRRADTYRDASVTLDFNSSILGDISSIKCSASKTIRLPKTLNNDAIFDLAHMPSHESSKARKVLSCDMYVDGVAVFSRGLCHLLSSDGDHYEIAMTFGIMHQGFEQWLTDKPKLRELTDYEEDAIPWNLLSGVANLGGGVSRIEREDYEPITYAMDYVDYNCGVDLSVTGREECNISPCVRLLEIWERIRRENGLSLSLDESVKKDMEQNVILLTKNNNTSLQTKTANAKLLAKLPPISTNGDSRRLFFNISDFFDIATSTFLQKGYGEVTITLPNIYLTMKQELLDTTSQHYQKSAADFFADRTNCSLVFEYPNGEKTSYYPSKATNYFSWSSRTLTLNYYQGDNVDGLPLLKMYIEIKSKWSSLPDDVWDNPNSGAYTTSWLFPMVQAFEFKSYKSSIVSSPVSMTYQNNSNEYPLASFSLVPNLPDITQIDFINMICKLYGLFPLAEGSSVRFVSIDRLADNISSGNVYDWSDKHLSDSLAPKNIRFAMDGFAKHNYLQYKIDDNDPISVKGDIKVDDDTLDNERTMYEFPLSASNGSLVPQFKMNDDGTIDKIECEYRLMRKDTMLSFSSLNPQHIVNNRYQTLQNIIKSTIVIEDDFILNEIDLCMLDYTKPVYLAKYGRYFAIISIQWQSDQQTSRVKLLRIK